MSMPGDGVIVADLITLKAYVGARTPQDDQLLQQRLDVAMAHIYERVYPDHRMRPEVQEAILLLASRLYKRRQSPEGVAGFGGEGGVIRILALDPDVAELIERHWDYTRAGIA